MGFTEVKEDLNGLAGLDVPELFPRASSFTKRFELREYVEAELVKLAESGQLCVTHLLNQQNSKLVNMCGEIIQGIILERGASSYHRDFRPDLIPTQLTEYRVKIQALSGHKLEWEVGMRQNGWIGRNGANQSNPQPRMGRVMMSSENQTEMVPLPKAWIALRRYGKYCRPENSEAGRAANWRYEEVLPVAHATAPTKKPQGLKAMVEQ